MPAFDRFSIKLPIDKRGKETKAVCTVCQYCVIVLFLSLAPTPNPVALQHFQSVENECYGVLGGGVPQSIELKDNAIIKHDHHNLMHLND